MAGERMPPAGDTGAWGAAPRGTVLRQWRCLVTDVDPTATRKKGPETAQERRYWAREDGTKGRRGRAAPQPLPERKKRFLT